MVAFLSRNKILRGASALLSFLLRHARQNAGAALHILADLYGDQLIDTDEHPDYDSDGDVSRRLPACAVEHVLRRRQG